MLQEAVPVRGAITALLAASLACGARLPSAAISPDHDVIAPARSTTRSLTQLSGPTNRCGSSWDDARSRCGQECPDNDDSQCTEGGTCWSDLAVSVCGVLPCAEVEGMTPASATYYRSYPVCCPGGPWYDPAGSTNECDNFNGCTHLGFMAAAQRQLSYEEIQSTDIVAFFKVGEDFSNYANKQIRIVACTGAGPVSFVANILDTCGDSDCGGCCTASATKGGREVLIDIEYHTLLRHFGPDAWQDGGYPEEIYYEIVADGATADLAAVPATPAPTSTPSAPTSTPSAPTGTPSSAGGSTGQSNQRCGLTWDKANANCYQDCPNDDDRDCSTPGHKCWSDLDMAPCESQDSTTPPKGMPSTVPAPEIPETITSPSGGSLLPGSCFDPITSECVSINNKYRSAAGIPELRCRDGDSGTVSVEHSKKMCSRGELYHDLDANGPAAFPNAMAAAENVAYTYAYDVPEVMALWYASKGHHKNMMNADYASVTYGYYLCNDTRVYWTAIFAAEDSSGGSVPGTPAAPRTPAASTPAAAPGSCSDPATAECIRLNNEYRAEVGVGPLTCEDGPAAETSVAHSKSMCDGGGLYHDLDGNGPAAFPSAMMRAENIAYTWAQDAAEVMQNWKVSEGHYKNMVNPGLTKATYGYYPCGDGRVYWTSIFAA